jgi:transcriptional regulator with XRE-family HTH domain
MAQISTIKQGGGELVVHDNSDKLSDIVKAARQHADITVEKLAEKIGVTERYLYRVENENRKPSYDVLFKLIRELNISPDSIFYPEKPFKDSEIEVLVRMLYNCDERSMEIIKATAKAALESQSK